MKWGRNRGNGKIELSSLIRGIEDYVSLCRALREQGV
jgi:hypothetical protein